MDKESFLTFKGKRIWYRLASPKINKKYPALLFIHGSHFSTSFGLLINHLKRYFICFCFAHLGCYKSEGNFEDYSLESRLQQSQFALSYLKKMNGIRSITILGISMGGHVAARLTEDASIKNLILRAPASYRKDYETVRMKPGWLPWNKKNKDWPWKPSYALDAIHAFKGNLLVVECENDEIIPDKMVYEYYKEATNVKSKKFEILKHAPHVMSQDVKSRLRFQKLIENFVKKRAEPFKLNAKNSAAHRLL
jgi:esterase/lipase